MDINARTELTSETSGLEAISQREKLTVILGVLVVMLLAALDQTIVAPALPTIGDALGDNDYLPWVITAYLLTGTAVAPLYGKVADIVGRRKVMATAILIFLFGSTIAALASDMLTLIIGRAVQGLGGGGLFVLAQTVIGDTVPPRERAAYAGYISATWAIASIAGPLLGGVFAQHLSWSLIFWVNIPLGLAALVVLAGPLRKLKMRPRSHKLDFLGGALVLFATTPLMLAMTWGGNTYAWSSGVILSLAALSLILWTALAARLASADEPLIPLEVLRNPVVAAATATMFFATAANVAIAVYMPIYMQAYFGLSVTASGIALIGYIMGTTLGAAVAGKLVSSLPRYKFLGVCGLSLAIVCLTILATLSTTPSLAVAEALLFMAGAGFGTIFPISTVSVQNAVDYHNLGIATATLTFMRNLGSAIGVAVIGAVALASGVPGLRETTLATDVAAPLMAASGFRHIFLAAAAIVLPSLFSIIVMEERPLRTTVGSE